MDNDEFTLDNLTPDVTPKRRNGVLKLLKRFVIGVLSLPFLVYIVVCAAVFAAAILTTGLATILVTLIGVLAVITLLLLTAITIVPALAVLVTLGSVKKACITKLFKDHE